MTDRTEFDEPDDDLVAYLDGELAEEQARALEARLAADPTARAEVDELRRTWELLDYLPRPEPSTNFTNRTLDRIGPLTTQIQGLARRRWRPVALGVGWAAALLLAALAGYAGFRTAVPYVPGDGELVRDLRVIEFKRYYDLVPDVEFLRQLEDPDLFGEDPIGS